MDDGPDPSDELWHEPADDPRWRESYYFDVYDESHDFAWFSTMGRKPHKEYMGSSYGFIWNGDAYFRKDYGRTTEDEQIRVGGQRYVPSVPNEKWAVRHMTEVNQFEPGSEEMLRHPDEFPNRETPLYGLDVELTFESIHPPQYFPHTEESEPVFGSIYDGHADHAVRVTGTVSIGEDTLQIDGYGGRDHSWGPRDWFAPESWRWITTVFDSSTAVNVWRLTNESGTATKGYLLLDDETHLLERVTLDTEFDEEGNQRSLQYEVEDAAGRVLEIAAEVDTNPLLMDFENQSERTVVRRAPATFRSRQLDVDGHGWTEYSKKTSKH